MGPVSSAGFASPFGDAAAPARRCSLSLGERVRVRAGPISVCIVTAKELAGVEWPPKKGFASVKKASGPRAQP